MPTPSRAVGSATSRMSCHDHEQQSRQDALAERKRAWSVREPGNRLLVRQGVVVGAIGVAVGVAVTLAAAGQVAPLLFGISPREPVLYVVVAGAMLIVAAAASVVPAIRAGRVDPTVALRSE